MKRGLFFHVFVLAVAAISRPAMAQEVEARTGAIVVTDSTVVLPAATAPVQLPASSASSPEIRTIGVSPMLQVSAEGQAQAAQGGVKGFFFGTQRRTSNTLMIGGVAVAGIGVGVVKGEIGALLGVLGLLSSIGGLYLAF